MSHIDMQLRLQYFEDQARALADGAAELGVVLTIEQVPLQPPAMGHYETRVSVRLARARAESNIDTGDHVLHIPSGETWLVAGVAGRLLYACGWPCTAVPVDQCTLVRKVTDERRAELRAQLAAMQASDPRQRFGRCPPMPETTNAVRDVLAEVDRATTKFPTWPTDPLHAVAVLGEEFGELTKAMLERTYEPHKGVTLADIRKEAIQTAAMALRLVMSLDVYDYRRQPQHQQGGANLPETTLAPSSAKGPQE